MREIFQAVAQTLKEGQSVALITVIRSIGSTPRHATAKMVVRADGSFVGTIGGGTMEREAIRDAQTALTMGTQRLVKYSLIGKTSDSMGLCGGTQEVFIDVLSSPSASHCAKSPLSLFEAMVTACEIGEPAALLTVIHAEKGEGWQVGDKLLLRYDKSTCGQFDGSELEMKLLEEAQKALQENRSIRLGYQPKLERFTRLNSFEREPLEIFVDVVQPKPKLLIIGAGHIGVALAAIGRVLGMRVILVDDRPNWMERFPDVDEAILVAYDPVTEILGPLSVPITPSTYIVVATWGWDEPALEQVVGSPAAYIGLVASLRKAKIIFDDLLERGVAIEKLARVRVPAGLDLRAETPEEIALSIMAEILALQRDATGLPLMEIKGHPLSLSTKQVWEKIPAPN